MIEAIQEYFLPCLITTIVVIYISSKILRTKPKFSNLRIYIVPIFMILLSIFNFVYIDNHVRFFVSTLYTIIGVKLIFDNIPLHKVTAAVLIEQLSLFIAELIYALLIILVLNFDINALYGVALGSLATNLIVSIIAIILIHIKIIRNLYDKITFSI